MRVDIISLRSRWVSAQSDNAIKACAQRARDRGHDVRYPKGIFGASMITRARNKSLRFVRLDGDFVLFIDDDMLPLEGGLVRLMSHDLPVVGAMYVTRQIPPEIVGKIYNVERSRFAEFPELNEDAVVTGPFALGFGMILVKTETLKQVIDYVLSGQDWVDLNRNLLDRLKVRAEVREAERRRIEEIRRRIYDKDQQAPVFQFTIGDETQTEINEDYHFSRLLHHMGIPVAIDTGCLVGHLGDFPYSPINLGMKVPADLQL